MSEIPQQLDDMLPKINGANIAYRLRGHLLTHDGTASAALHSRLMQDTEPFFVEDVFNDAHSGLTDYAEAVAANEQPKLVAEIVAAFPSAYQTHELMSPRQYLQSNGFDQSRRPLLAKAKQQATADVADRL